MLLLHLLSPFFYTRGQTKMNISDPIDLCGLTWAGLFRVRNSIARRYAGRWGDIIPIEEFLSAGNAALAEVLTDPALPADRDTLLRWLRHRMKQKMWQVVGDEFGREGHTGKLQPLPETLALSVGYHAAATDSTFAHVYLREVCMFLAQYPYPLRLESFWMAMEGAGYAEIASMMGVTRVAIKRSLMRLRRDLWRWAGDSSAKDRCPGKLSSVHQCRVRDLRRQGLSIRQIGRMVGRGKTTVFEVLHEAGAYAVAAAD